MERHQPRRRFGQNFLADPYYVGRIVDAIAPRQGDNLVEIGPGLGALTQPLIERAGHLTAIEIDRDLAARLASQFPREQLSLHVVDALEFDFAALGTALRVVGNLPYNISTPLLFHLARFADRVADLTVMLQTRFRVTKLFTVPPGAFRPAPTVDSAVARLTPLTIERPRIADQDLYERIVAAAFSQRRKTLRNALSALCDESTLQAAQIDPKARGETLAVADFVRLANALATRADARS